jgi:hypothetical protein
MIITRTSQGFELFKLLDSNHVVKMTYIGYSLTESKTRFKRLVKEQKEFIKSVKK